MEGSTPQAPQESQTPIPPMGEPSVTGSQPSLGTEGPAAPEAPVTSALPDSSESPSTAAETLPTSDTFAATTPAPESTPTEQSASTASEPPAQDETGQTTSKPQDAFTSHRDPEENIGGDGYPIVQPKDPDE